MSRSVRSFIAAGTAAAVLVAVSSTVSYSAGAKSVLLGKANSSAKATTLKRTAPGPALSLQTKPGSPPLSVGSRTKVARLNADLLDGLDSRALEPPVRSFVDADTTTARTNVFYNIPVPAGTYRVDVNAALVGAGGATVGFCGIRIGGAFSGGTSSPFLSTFRANVSMSKVITTGGALLEANCQVDTGTFTYFPSSPLTVSVTPVRSVTTTSISPTP